MTLPLLTLTFLIVFAIIRSYLGWKKRRFVMSIVLLVIAMYGVMCLWLKLKELL